MFILNFACSLQHSLLHKKKEEFFDFFFFFFGRAAVLRNENAFYILACSAFA